MRLTILQVNDSHGYLEPRQEYYWDGEVQRFGKAGGSIRGKRTPPLSSPPRVYRRAMALTRLTST